MLFFDFVSKIERTVISALGNFAGSGHSEGRIAEAGLEFMARRRDNPNWGKPEPVGPVTGDN